MQSCRLAARWKQIPKTAHGTLNGYGYWDCRCERCRNAKRVENRRHNRIYKPGSVKQ
jgi:hypothetical protein